MNINMFKNPLLVTLKSNRNKNECLYSYFIRELIQMPSSSIIYFIKRLKMITSFKFNEYNKQKNY